jgi:catechol 2,3-dioxygenase-like lactoylglutathione lyase family enzyme
MSDTPPPLGPVQLVMIPSSDPDRSVEFYRSLGFEARNEQPWGDGFRWVELYPTTGDTGLALVPPSSSQPWPKPTAFIVHTDDVEATRKWMSTNGYEVDDAVARDGGDVPIDIGAVHLTDPFPPMFWLRDPDGNGVLVIQPG